jgi:imidazolonepropionase-like amidohydrolase
MAEVLRTMLTLTNARIFDGHSMLSGRRTVTLEGNRIASLGSSSEPAAANSVDLDGMTLMPGLITSHLHADFFRFGLPEGMAGEPLGKEFPPGVMMAIGIRTCRVLLESGFTGYVGASCSNDVDAQLKIAIAEGIVTGPRIRACGHHIGTSADLNDSKKWWRKQQSAGTDLFVDGPEDLRRTVREEIRRGVETIKIFASRGHGFPSRTARNMSRDELAMIVNTAHERGVRVRAHVADREMILECLELGVDILDHGDDVDEHCIELMARAGTFWVPSLTYPRMLLELGWGDIDGLGVMQARYEHVRKMLPIAHRAGVRILIGDDYSGVFRDTVKDDPLDHQVGRYGLEFAFYAGIDGIKASDVLTWGTKNPGQLLVDAPAKLGVIESGALADLIVVDGDPLENLSLLSQPEKALKAVIRDGALLIDRLSPTSARRAA